MDELLAAENTPPSAYYETQRAEKTDAGKTPAVPVAIIDSGISLESRRYIGSKSKLTDWIIGKIKKEARGAKSFIDIFAGTASVSKAAFGHFEIVIINDILHSNNVIYKAFFAPGRKSAGKINSLLEKYNSLNPSELEDNYFSTNFGGKFFDYEPALLIGHIREDIERRKKDLTDKEYNILLATLIYNIDKIANTVGHFDAYIKKPIKPRKLNLRPIEAAAEFAGVKIYREDANELARRVAADIAYIDPPYNSRQYNRFYHIYETLVKWNSPELFGVALKPVPEDSSVYCTVKAKDAFADLVGNLKVKYLAVSYNNTYNSKSSSSENKIKLEEIEAILKSRGKTKVFESSHRFFNAGKTEFDNHKEFLFLTKVND